MINIKMSTVKNTILSIIDTSDVFVCFISKLSKTDLIENYQLF